MVREVWGGEKKLPGLPQDKDGHRIPLTPNETEARRVGPRHQEKWRLGHRGLVSRSFL